MAIKAIFKVYDDDDSEQYYRKEITWTLDEKLEYDLNLINTSKSINYAAITYIKLIVFSGDARFKVRFTTSTDTVTFYVDDFFYFTPETLDDFTEIVVMEDNGVEVNVKIRFYGDTSES